MIEVAAKWSSDQLSKSLSSLKRITPSSKIPAQTLNQILEISKKASDSAKRAGGKAVNLPAMAVNAILASDFSETMDKWLRDVVEQCTSVSVYDRALDATYNATKIGGGLHRLFDESHTLWDAWDKVREALPGDTLFQEVSGYTSALLKDFATPMGLPFFNMSRDRYHDIAGYFNEQFDWPKDWFSDFLTVNAAEMFSTTIGVIAIALNWNKREVKQFSTLASSLGASAIIQTNPILGVVVLVSLARALMDARKENNYGDFIKGLTKGGVGTGLCLATASAVGGPAWIGIVAGLCVGCIVHKGIESVDITEIRSFVESSLHKIIPEQRQLAI